MKIKPLLRFYRSAEKLNGFLDGFMWRLAMRAGEDFYSGGELYAEQIIALIGEKEKLARLWTRLDGVLKGLTEADRTALYYYAGARTAQAGKEQSREIHRAVVKFSRRAAGIINDGKSLRLVHKYYCLLNPPAVGGQ